MTPKTAKQQQEPQKEIITAINKQLRRALLNQEINSITYEGCVGIAKGYKVIQAGLKIDTLNTNDKISTLWAEYCEQEGITQELNELQKEDGNK